MKFDKLVQFLNESTNKYTIAQKFAIAFWGQTGYMTGSLPVSFPDEQKHFSNIIKDIQKYVKFRENYSNLTEDELDEFEELNSWFDEGAKTKTFGGQRQYHFSKNILYSALDSAQTILTEPLKVCKFIFKSSKITSVQDLKSWLARDANRYGSWTTNIELDNYMGKSGDEDKHIVQLLPGTKVIFTYDLADADEVIIKSSEILKNL